VTHSGLGSALLAQTWVPLSLLALSLGDIVGTPFERV